MIETKLKFLRRQTGKTQEEFARSIGYSRTHYAAVESGKRSLSIDMMNHICEVYDLSRDYFLGSVKPPDCNSDRAIQLRAEISHRLENCDATFLQRILQVIEIFT